MIPLTTTVKHLEQRDVGQLRPAVRIDDWGSKYPTSGPVT